MCLAIPGKIEEVKGNQARINFSGTVRDAAIDLIPDARPGEYVLVHAGFAIQRIDEKEALETLKLFEQMFGKKG